MREKVLAEDRVREIRQKARKKHSSKEKALVVLEGLRDEAASQPCACVIESLHAEAATCIVDNSRSSGNLGAGYSGKAQAVSVVPAGTSTC